MSGEGLHWSGAVTLGGLIDALEALPAEMPLEMCGGYPNEFGSWRGSYSELTVFWEQEPVTVGEFLAKARAANGATFTGYKGGVFTMDRGTSVWADPYGEAGERCIKGVGLRGKSAFLIVAEGSW